MVQKSRPRLDKISGVPDGNKTDQQCLEIKKSLDLQERHQETIKDGRLLDESKKKDALKKSREARSKSIDERGISMTDMGTTTADG